MGPSAPRRELLKVSINRVQITGNLTRDPELRMTTNGTQVLNFGMAVNDRRRNQQTGEWEDRPNFIDCVIFGQRADSLSKILRKGFKCAIDGKLRQNVWESEGQRRSRIEVVVDDIDFMQRTDGGAGRPPQTAAPQQPPAPQPSYNQAPQPQQQDVYQDDIPF